MQTKNQDSKKWMNDILKKIDNHYIEKNFSKEEITLAKDLLSKGQTDVNALHKFHAAFPIEEKRDILIVAFTPRMSKETFEKNLKWVFAQEKVEGEQ